MAACRDPANHHYTPTAGLPELREAIAAKTKRDSGFEVAASQVLVTNGGKQAVANAFAVLCDPGDEVLVPAPYWTTYPEAIALAGGVPVVVAADEATGFRVIGGRARGGVDAAHQGPALRVARPTRPGPSTPGTRSRPSAGGRWSAGIWVLTDEIYEHLVYGGAEHHSMPVLVPELADRCLVVNGVAKTYAMTGWRVGWMIGPADAIAAATNIQSPRDLQRRQRLPAGRPGRRVGRPDGVAQMREAFDRRRRTITGMLNEIDGVVCVEPEGAFYAFPSVKGLLGRTIRGHAPGDQRRAGRAVHRRGQGGGGARRGLRGAGVLPHVLRPGRRGPGRRRLPVGRAVRRGATTSARLAGARQDGSA